MKKKFIVLMLAGAMAMSLVACGEAKKVTEMIDGIGAVTLDSGDSITEAESAYNELSDTDKGKVENYENLVSARNDYDELVLENQYNEAKEELSNGNYDEAKADFEALGDYSDASNMVIECDCEKANSLIADGSYQEAMDLISGIENYTTNEELKHIYAICDVHINGLDGLTAYMKDNFELNSDGEYAKTVTVHRNAAFTVLFYYAADNDCLKVQITNDDSSTNGTLTHTLKGDGVGEYSYIFQDLTQISALQAYNSAYYITVNGNYYIGYIINAYGNVDMATYKAGDEVNIDKFTFTTSDEDDDEKTKTMNEETAALLSPMFDIELDGIQELLDECELNITVQELYAE